MSVERLATEAVVVGAGIAGLTTALALAGEGRRVVVLSRLGLGDGAATGWAQGGIAAALAADDAPALHARDTLAAAAGIADRDAVAVLTDDAAEGIAALVSLGVAFDRDAAGALALGREAAHGRRRIVHAAGDATGRIVLDTLVGVARRTPRLRIIEQADARELLLSDGRVGGVLARVGGGWLAADAAAVVLATGGIGGLFAATTNPLAACGEGIALAARAGAVLADLEFVQFHPTALAAPGVDPLPLVTEALRGEGAWLVDDRGERFMPAVDPAAELAPRDVVARATFARLAAGRRVFLDARSAVGEAFPRRFPTVFAAATAAGIDPRREPLPVTPAAHYHMGGIATDLAGRTSVAGLWACGEVAATGVHGANRLASNSLLEGLVFGRRVAADVAAADPRPAPGGEIRHQAQARARELAPRALGASSALRRLTFAQVGVVRDAPGLTAALDDLDRLAASGSDDPDRLTVARLVAAAALARRESRGGHYRRDYPAASAASARRSFVMPASDRPLVARSA